MPAMAVPVRSGGWWTIPPKGPSGWRNMPQSGSSGPSARDQFFPAPVTGRGRPVSGRGGFQFFFLLDRGLGPAARHAGRARRGGCGSGFWRRFGHAGLGRGLFGFDGGLLLRDGRLFRRVIRRGVEGLAVIGGARLLLAGAMRSWRSCWLCCAAWVMAFSMRK